MYKTVGELLEERGITREDFFNALPENIEDLKGAAVIHVSPGEIHVNTGEDALKEMEGLD